MCHPKGTGVFAAFWSENLRKRVYTSPVLVCNRVWFSRELPGVYELHIRLRKKEKYANSGLKTGMDFRALSI